MAQGTSIPRSLVGRNVALFYGGAMYINGDGSLSPAGDFNDFHSAGTFDTFDFSADFGLEDVSPTDALIKTFAQTTADFDLTVGEIQQPSGYSKLAQIGFGQSSYLGIEAVTQDPVTGQQMVFSCVGIFGSLKFGIQRGKNVIMAQIKPCGIFPYYQPSQGGAQSGATGGLNSGNVRKPNVVTSAHP